jgi:hypothetical protein
LGSSELEHTQRDAVIEYLQMPEKVRNIEGEVAAIRSDISQLTSTLRQLFDAEGNGQQVRLRMREAKMATLLRIYYEHSRFAMYVVSRFWQ